MEKTTSMKKIVQPKVPEKYLTIDLTNPGKPSIEFKGRWRGGDVAFVQRILTRAYLKFKRDLARTLTKGELE